jgi:hypothetical protein
MKATQNQTVVFLSEGSPSYCRAVQLGLIGRDVVDFDVKRDASGPAMLTRRYATSDAIAIRANRPIAGTIACVLNVPIEELPVKALKLRTISPVTSNQTTGRFAIVEFLLRSCVFSRDANPRGRALWWIARPRP